MEFWELQELAETRGWCAWHVPTYNAFRLRVKEVT